MLETKVISKWLEMIRIVPLSPCECRAMRPGKSEKAKKMKEQTKSMKNRNVIFATILSGIGLLPPFAKSANGSSKLPYQG